MRTDELDYELPPGLIATRPSDPRDAARLMVVRRAGELVEHRHIRDLPVIPGAVCAGDLIVFNRTRVLPARFDGVRRGTGGRVSGLYLGSDTPGDWRVMLESGGSLREGETVDLSGQSSLRLDMNQGGGRWAVRLKSPLDTSRLLAEIGRTPLPPYILKQRRAVGDLEEQPLDTDRYNTVFADDPGSVAAPTAGLHFTPALIQRLEQAGVRIAYVTLHVGLGTFAPVRATRLGDHEIHSEWFQVSAETVQAITETHKAGGRIVPVGTTSVRAIESLPCPIPVGGYSGSTNLYIRPDAHGGASSFNFRFTDALLTNFHLPRSTLLALVAALPETGIERLLSWYRQAVEHGYRFYSYGDAMLIL